MWGVGRPAGYVSFGRNGQGDGSWFIEHYNLRLVVLTAGGAYSTIYTANEESTLQTPEVQVADTVGAGDAFSGALVISLLKGASLREAHEFAVRTAAYVCTKEGAWPAIRGIGNKGNIYTI